MTGDAHPRDRISRSVWRPFIRTLIEFPGVLRAAAYRLATPAYFRKLGRGGLILGPQNFAHPYLDIRIGNRFLLGRRIFWQVARGAAIRIGDRVSINDSCFLVCSVAISIGDNVAIAEHVSIRDQEHRFDPDHGVRDQGYKKEPISIEENCWIGRGCYISPGTRIRRGSIVAANSVVRGEFPSDSLIAGAPAVVKKSLRS
jgi:acetyltransferase-like isoleucine patch superfamily enzyme